MLKTANRAPNQYRCVIGDFGCAMQLVDDIQAHGTINSTEGTYAFFSPEACSGNSFNGYTADVWALGVTLYVSSFGMLPFKAKGDYSTSLTGSHS